MTDSGAREASAGGAMMCVLMRVREPHVLARACDQCVAMQLTNITRDVAEDARAGRLFLPRPARMGIWAGIGSERPRNGCEFISRRAHTSKMQRLGWIAKAIVPSDP